MLDKLKSLIGKYQETIKYVIFGSLTTLVDFAAFFLLNDILKIPSKDLSQFLSQFIAMVFAFFANKILVFNERTRKPLTVLKMFIEFASFRFITIMLNNGFFFIFCTKLGYNEYLVKLIGSIVVVVLNYIFSKLVVFAKKEKHGKD